MEMCGTFRHFFAVYPIQKGGEDKPNVDTCEDQFIQRAALGDEEAFRQLWEAHHALAMAAALRLCHQRALAEEITQGAFVLAWRGLPRFQPGCPFRPWFMRILYRHALDVMEKQRVYSRFASLDEINEVEVQRGIEGQNQADLQEQVAQSEEIRRALAALKSDFRRVVILRYGADLTEADIAHVLGWPIGTVKSRLNRARDQLRRLLIDERENEL